MSSLDFIIKIFTTKARRAQSDTKGFDETPVVLIETTFVYLCALCGFVVRDHFSPSAWPGDVYEIGNVAESA